MEGDASSASYFLAGATITGGTVTVEGCGSDSLQGDVRFAEVRTGGGGGTWHVCSGRQRQRRRRRGGAEKAAWALGRVVEGLKGKWVGLAPYAGMR